MTGREREHTGYGFEGLPSSPPSRVIIRCSGFGLIERIENGYNAGMILKCQRAFMLFGIRFVAVFLCCCLLAGCSSRKDAFLKACQDGGLQQVQRLAKKVDIECRSSDSQTGLMMAAEHGNSEVVSFLISQGAKPEQMDDNGNPASTYAANGGYVGIVDYLIEEMLKSDSAVAGEKALISLCRAKKDYPDRIKTVLAKGVDPNVRDQDGWTALMCAAFRGNLEVCKLLLKAGADPNIGCGGKEWTWPIVAAASGGNEGIVELLIKHGADISVTDYTGETILKRAIYLKYWGVVRKLMSGGCDPNVTLNGVPMLFIAAEGKYFELANILLDYGARTEYELKDGTVISFYSYVKEMGITNFTTRAAAKE